MTQEELGIQILQNCRNELYCLFPALDGAFASLSYSPGKQTDTIVTDGDSIFFSPSFLCRCYGRNPAAVRRGYLHMLLHCLFGHPFHERDGLWDLACDLAVEKVIEREQIPRLELRSSIRDDCLSKIRDSDISAGKIHGMLSSGCFPYPIGEMAAAFRFDDHRIWTKACNADKWERIFAYTRQNQGNRNPGTKGGSASERITPAQKNRLACRDYLHQFMQTREETDLDMESFDYIYYNFGMEHYGNLPLIEHLEYREVNRLAELVIAIDTSGSCSKETVEQFLAEMFAIFQEKENFFREMKVYIIQCDCCIQDVALIRSEEDWKEYGKSVVIQGRGGTDFTPVFRYVNNLRKKRELRELKAVLYFTDGDGIYPRTKPDYETAFILLQGAAKPELVPNWATKLLIG